MTSFSPRKRRTTRPNTRPSTCDGRIALAVALICAMAGGVRAEDPLSRLKSRSAQDTWSRLSQQTPRPVAVIPEAEPRPAAADAKLLPSEDEEGIPAITAEEPTGIEPAQAGGRAFLTAMQPSQRPIPQVTDPVRDPKDLKKLREIRPYFDYEPDGSLEDPCQNLCPRPGHCPDCLRTRREDLLEGQIGCPECPEEVVLSREMYTTRAFPPIAYHWEAANLFYKPLYFEDVPLERYGHTRNIFVQPVFSVAKFTAQGLFLPYQLSLCPPWRCRTPLGYYRPGVCVPYKYYQVPLDGQAALVQAATVTGAYYLFAP